MLLDHKTWGSGSLGARTSLVECEMIQFVFRLIILMEDGFNPGLLKVSSVNESKTW